MGRRPRHRAAVHRRAGPFKRTSNRHDYALEPTGETLLDRADATGRAGRLDRQDQRPVRRPRHRARDAHRQRRRRHGAARRTLMREAARRASSSSNLVDFDTLYGHRNDVARLRARTSSGSTGASRGSLPALRDSRSARRHRRPRQRSEHARAPIIRANMFPCCHGVAGCQAPGADLETRRHRRPDATFADLGETLAANFGAARSPHGTSCLRTSLSTIREGLEQRERETLAPQAAKSARYARPAQARARGRRPSGVSSAIATASSTARPFAGLKHKTQCSSRPRAITTARA